MFQNIPDRLQQASQLLEFIFPNVPTEAIQYELKRQGLLLEGNKPLDLDVWQIIEQQMKLLQNEWQGPTIPIYIFPIIEGHSKNGIAYKNGICLFISNTLSTQQLQALITHEYHHSCKRHLLTEPLTLLDSMLMEGLAEEAVETYFGKDALSPWTERYSISEVQSFWNTHFIPNLNQIEVQNHQAFLFGDSQLGLPQWIGYCMGYRIVQSFKKNYGPIHTKNLLTIPSEEILALSEFTQMKKE